jgi:hypothetical protein
MINNRQQSGRRRGRGGQRQGGGGGGPSGGGNRIDNRARGNANQLYEKYKNLAADAQRQGDRVQTEYYLQFADHYYRVLAETRPRFDEQQRQGRGRDDGFDDDGDMGDDEFGDEGESIRPGEQHQQQQPRGDGGQRRYEERRPQQGDDRRPREDGERSRRDGSDRMNGPDRVNGQRVESSDAPRREPRADVEGEPDLPLPAPQDDAPPASRRRGRPRKDTEQPAAQPAASQPAAIEADRLPPALGAPANDADAPAEEPKPRRRRTRSTVEAPAAE